MKLDETILPELALPPICPHCGHGVDVTSCGGVWHVSNHDAWEIADRLACARAGALAALDEAITKALAWSASRNPDNGGYALRNYAKDIRRLRDTIMEGE